MQSYQHDFITELQNDITFYFNILDKLSHPKIQEHFTKGELELMYKNAAYEIKRAFKVMKKHTSDD